MHVLIGVRVMEHTAMTRTESAADLLVLQLLLTDIACPRRQVRDSRQVEELLCTGGVDADATLRALDVADRMNSSRRCRFSDPIRRHS